MIDLNEANIYTFAGHGQWYMSAPSGDTSSTWWTHIPDYGLIRCVNAISIQQMIKNEISCRAELPDIHECDGMTTSGLVAAKPCQNFEEGIGSIFYVIMIF